MVTKYTVGLNLMGGTTTNGYRQFGKTYDTLEEATAVFTDLKYKVANDKLLDYSIFGTANTFVNTAHIEKIFMTEINV